MYGVDGFARGNIVINAICHLDVQRIHSKPLIIKCQPPPSPRVRCWVPTMVCMIFGSANTEMLTVTVSNIYTQH
ncbi:hypothetical protein M378DRAFT_296655 [Amanita muscaria Koide BX008]|uniref:Uncharacterized protein n=1 Tax=Amanita muscaria (strain Koide BX008) TaxID=946122 RepID=A0A0C2TJL9_AMAMK|nr:hypothetical protein M378DRAFT_296655 [Amanita muscaria Koide BX008]